MDENAAAVACMASTHLCVRLLSGVIVYEGLRPHSLTQLRDAVAATMGCKGEELVFLCGDEVLDCIEAADEEITAVRDQVMGLLGEFLRHAPKKELPERLWPARGHRRLVLAAVAINPDVLQHASAELRADRNVVLAAVALSGHALRHASVELRADRDMLLAAVASCWPPWHATAVHAGMLSRQIEADRRVVLTAMAYNNIGTYNK